MARQAKGSKSTVQIDFESDFGTVNTIPKSIVIPINTSGIKSKQNLIDPKDIRGIRDPAEPSRGNIDVSGSISVPLDTVNIGYWLKGAFGAPTTAAGEKAGTYKHVFKITDEQPSMTVQQAFNDIGQYEVFTGCKVGKLGMSFGGEGEAEVSIDIMGAKEMLNSDSFDASPTAYPSNKYNHFQADAKEGGAVSADIRTVSLDIDFGLDGDTQTLGSKGFRTAVNEGAVVVSGNVNALFTNKTILEKSINGTTSSIEIKMTNGDDSLTISLPEITYERNSPSIDGPKGVLIELPYKAFYKENAGGSAVIVTLTNKHEQY